ncbi:DNA primase, catalytic core [Promicromonospora umidemergens]|uniref:Toprim domain-containing protein n=1 Tax=Promicromonospora umidemergens TaxID=629679 RepID=A0ABP8XH06_9MICO|nr:MobF family relaxase [Promicromonospora umidemergens]MCP2282796.1 DNA primase, catalytic core [Promicromonospora umidemergens]
MTVHVLSAGSGYTYLTQQVASGDVPRERGMSLTDYYMQHGNPPGRWVGTGLDQLGVSGQVMEKQMKSLYGLGRHPDADRLEVEALARGATKHDAERAGWIGRAFPTYEPRPDDGFRTALEAAFAQFAQENDRPPEAGIERDLIRWNVARTLAQQERNGKSNGSGGPVTEADVTLWLAKRGQQPRRAVAGYDLVFTPSKSISVLWGLGDPDTRDAITKAHTDAWQDTLAWIEVEGALTREGAGGVRQIDTHGLTAVAFDHLDSRAGDPNLHTHVAVSAKVRGVDGTWRALDGRVLLNLGVAASERYNTRIEQLLVERLGVAFHTEARGRGKQGVREIVGVPKKLRDAFSRRRAAIQESYENLRAEYRAKYGHEPASKVAYALAQQANLDTRQAKGIPVGLRDRLPQWHQVATTILGSSSAVARMLAGTLHPRPGAGRVVVDELEDLWPAVAQDLAGRGVMRWTAQDVTAAVERLAHTWPRAQVFRSLRWRTAAGRQAVFADLATQVLADGDLVDACLSGVADKRATWSTYHLQAEATRLAREYAPSGTDLLALSATIAGHAVAGSLVITPPDLNEPPDVMRRKDGESVYFVHGSTRYTSLAVLEAEDHLLAGARAGGGLITDRGTVGRAVARVEAEVGYGLNAGQRELVAHFATSGSRLAAGIGPAGTGKTTAMRAFAAAVDDAGGRLIALAPSAAAAEVLSADLGDSDITAETLDMFLLANAGHGGERLRERLTVEPGTVVLIDEASLAGTLALSQVLTIAQAAGGSVRLLGDPAQLGAVAAGGALRLIADQAGAVELTQIHRFNTDGEAEASLLIREGNHAGLDFYVTRNRTQGGSAAAMAEQMFANWQVDSDQGFSTLMMAATNTLVTELSVRARLHRVTRGEVEEDGVVLHDDTRAGVGDIIVTRLNNRYLRTEEADDVDADGGDGGWVKNGHLWRVHARGKNGDLQVRHLETGATVVLPADYVAAHVELGYATTIHREQGTTVDTAHAMVGVGMTRNELYTAITRGRYSNRVYVETDDVLDLDPHRQPNLERAVLNALKAVLDRDGEEQSASAVIEAEWGYAHSLARLVPEYEDAYFAYLEPDRTGRLADALRAVLPERMADRVLADDAWPALAKRLSQHEAAGADVQAVVHRAAQQGFQGARSIAKVLHHRVDLPRPCDLDQRGLPAWITTSPGTTENLAWNDVRPFIPAETDQTRDTHPDDAPERPESAADTVADDVARMAPADPTGQAARPVDAGERALVVEITGHAWTWWTAQSAHQSWATRYMTGRGLAGAEWGTAPPSWTGLSDHLQTLGYTPEQLVTAGVATRTRGGRLIDKFRNRIIFPYRDQTGTVVGVTARINPTAADERTPKYLNTPETVAYRKGELLLGLDPTAIARLAAGARPVLVEGPTDHAALHLAASDLAERTGIEIVPIAAGGTGVTEAHLQALREATGRDLSDLIVALDPDNAGRTAAARVWDLLTAHEAAHVQALDLPGGTDPAQAALEAPEVLAAALGETVPLVWFAMEPNLAHLRSLDHFDRQIPLLRALVDYLYGRVELTQWWDLVAHVAKIVGDSPGAATHAQLDVGSVRRVMVDHLTDRITAGVSADTGPDIDPVAAVDNAAVPGREHVVTDPLVQTWLVRHADLIATRLDALVEDAVTNPQLWMEIITPPPTAGPTRGTWAAAMRQVLAYRDRYQVTDRTNALGRGGLEGERGDAYAIAARALASITAAEDTAPRPVARSGPRPMERVPVVLADARAHRDYERRRQQADEQARRDHTERDRDRASGRGR